METIDWIVLIVILFNAALGIGSWVRSIVGMRLVTVYFVVQSVLEVWSDILLIHHTETLALYHIFVPILFLILSFLFATHLKNRELSNQLFVICIGVMLLCWIISVTVQPVSEVNSYAHLLTRLVLCIWVILYFRQLLFVDDYEPLIPNYMFWVSIAILIHVANYCFWGMANVLYKYDRSLVSQWYSNILVLDILFYTILALPSYQLWYKTLRLSDAK